MEITNVGLAMDTLEFKNGIVCGEGTVYSKDKNDPEYPDFEYCDDFRFSYDLVGGLVITDIDEVIFKDYLELIDIMLIDNLKTNYLQK